MATAANLLSAVCAWMGIRPFLGGGLVPYSGHGEETCSPKIPEIQGLELQGPELLGPELQGAPP